MRIKDWLRFLLVFSVELLLFTMPMLTACNGGGGEQEEEEEEEEEEEASEFDIVMEAVEAYLADKAGNMNASDLFLLIAEDNAPYIVSVRSATDYAAGHIPGAVNVAFGDWDEIPEDEEILVYCYTGQSASFAAAVLGVQGYDVTNLLHGMSFWSTDSNVYKKRFNPDTSQGDFEVEKTPNAGGSFALPTLENTTSNDAATIIKAAAATVSPKYIAAKDLNMKIAEGEDMTIISVRSAEHYAAGHIPGATNLAFGELGTLPMGEEILVYCYTGQSASFAAARLGLVGYDVNNLLHGMSSWSDDPAVYIKRFNPEKAQGDYKVETTPNTPTMSYDSPVLENTAQYVRRSWYNRNRIMTQGGPQWITVPVQAKGHYTSPIVDILIDQETAWQRKITEAIRHAYRNAPHFEKYFPSLSELLARRWTYLCDLSEAALVWSLEQLGRPREFVRASALGAPPIPGT